MEVSLVIPPRNLGFYMYIVYILLPHIPLRQRIKEMVFFLSIAQNMHKKERKAIAVIEGRETERVYIFKYLRVKKEASSSAIKRRLLVIRSRLTKRSQI